MADVRSLLKNERAARRIQHKYASYSTTGTLICLACHLQLKSETLWEGHLRSAGHKTRVQQLEAELQSAKPSDTTSKKRKASEDDGGEDTLRKRSKPTNGLPEGFFDPGMEKEASPAIHAVEMQIPSRPATPSKPTEVAQKVETQVDEDEWAAFEADIATAEAQVTAANDAVISAPAMTAEDIKKRTAEEEYNSRKEKQEAEIEGDKEDAARKMEEELEEMESLEARVRKLRAKREELRTTTIPKVTQILADSTMAEANEDDDDEDDENDEDQWFR